MCYKAVLTIIASFLLIGSYIPYFRDIYSGKTKPHAFSWFIWSLSACIAFAASIVKGGGAGAWVMGMSGAACFILKVANKN